LLYKVIRPDVGNGTPHHAAVEAGSGTGTVVPGAVGPNGYPIVLTAVNDHLDIHGRMSLSPTEPIPELLADLPFPDQEILQAVGDLHELGPRRGNGGRG